MPSYLADLDQLRNNSADPEEDDQDYLNPPPPPPSINSSDPEEDDSAPASKLFGTPIKSAAAQPRVKAAYDAVQSVNAERPTRTKPGFWRTLASLGVGLGAGYSNAGGKFKQQDVGQIVENGINGPYNRKMSDWQQKQKDAQETLKAAQETDKGEQEYLDAPGKRAQTDANTDYLHAETDWRKAEADKSRHQKPDGPKAIHTETKVNGATGKMVQIVTYDDGTVQTTPLDIADEKKPKKVQSSRDIVDAKGKVTQLITYEDGSSEEKPVNATSAPKTDPLADDRLRIQAQEDSQRRTFDHQNTVNDQHEIDRLQTDEQKLHKLRGAIGREMRKGDNDMVNDPVTGKPMKDAAGKPVRKKQAWQSLQDQYDQATTQAQELQEQQKRLMRRNGGGASSDPLGVRQ